MAARRLPFRADPAPNPPRRRVRVTFDGKAYEGFEGEPLAVTLLAHDRPILSRSFRFHRPRGLMCSTGQCGWCECEVDGGPSVRSCQVPVRDGLVARGEHAWPSVGRDLFGWLDLGSRLVPPTFYHHRFLRPRALRKRYLDVIRGFGGRGRLGDGSRERRAHAGRPRARGRRPGGRWRAVGRRGSRGGGSARRGGGARRGGRGTGTRGASGHPPSRRRGRRRLVRRCRHGDRRRDALVDPRGIGHRGDRVVRARPVGPRRGPARCDGCAAGARAHRGASRPARRATDPRRRRDGPGSVGGGVRRRRRSTHRSGPDRRAAARARPAARLRRDPRRSTGMRGAKPPISWSSAIAPPTSTSRWRPAPRSSCATASWLRSSTRGVGRPCRVCRWWGQRRGGAPSPHVRRRRGCPDRPDARLLLRGRPRRRDPRAGRGRLRRPGAREAPYRRTDRAVPGQVLPPIVLRRDGRQRRTDRRPPDSAAAAAADPAGRPGPDGRRRRGDG